MFKVQEFDIKKFDSILSRGLSMGLGKQGSQVCIEAAICETLGLEHGDDPGCVSAAVRSFKITLNDSNWSSPEARAAGLRDLGIAQLGSKGVVDDIEFSKLLAKKTIQIIIPKIFRSAFPNNPVCLDAADLCEKEGTESAAESAWSAAWSAAESARSAAWSAAWSAAESAAESACSAESAAESARSARSAAWSAESAANPDEYLLLSAYLALETLRELKSPGVALLKEKS